MFIKDFKKEFYDVIQHQRVLVLVAFDVDAICACKILQYLFQCDQILYTIVPVSSKDELEKAFIENSEGIQHIILLNCGGTIDLVEILQPDDHVIFYICDSHRPVEVHNIYNQVQVKLLMKQEDFDDIPEYNELFRDEGSENEDSGNDSDGSEPSGKRKRFDAEALEKRHEKRLWEQKRHQIVMAYTEFTGYGTSASLLMFEMAWKMSKDTNDLLWLGIIGVTEQYINYKVERDKYIEDVGHLQSHVSRHNHRPDDDENTISVDCLKISFDQELQLSMYRHWSLFESICHSIYTACKFKVWTLKGKKRLHEFLADMGLPLVQCKQKFVSMDVNLKESIKDMINSQLDKYTLDSQVLFIPSFYAQYGYKNKFCSTDIVLVCDALLESVDIESSPSDNFLKALDILTRTNFNKTEKGLDQAKLQLKAIVNQIQSFLDMNQVISAGPFLYGFIQDGTPDVKVFANPNCLQKLARYTLQAYCSMSKSKKAKSLPLVLGCPYDAEKGTTLIVGVPPAFEPTRKNFFGTAFEQAATNTGSRTLHQHFDTNVIEMKTEDKSKFFDALISLLQ